MGGSILGNRVLRKEDPKFLTTGGVYVDDMRGTCQKWFGVHVIDIDTAGGKKLRIFFA